MKRKLVPMLLAALIIFGAMSSLAFTIDFHQQPMGELRYFETETILREWVASHELSIVMIGGGSLQNYNADPRYDCDEYAEDLRRLAEKDGYILTPVPVFSGSIWSVRVSDAPMFHVGCWTMVGNTYYYVEPFPLKSSVVRIMDAD